MKEVFVRFKDNGKTFEYGAHIAMHNMIRELTGKDVNDIPCFEIIAPRMVRFYTEQEIRRTGNMICDPIIAEADPIVYGFNLTFAPSRKDPNTHNAIPVKFGPEGTRYIKDKLIKLLENNGAKNANVSVSFGHNFRDTFKKGIGVDKVAVANATISFAEKQNIAFLMEHGYGKFKFSGMGFVSNPRYVCEM